MPASAGSVTFILLATSDIALMKQADQPAANNCSGLVPGPGPPGAENLTSKRPSSLRETPLRRPPEVWVLAVYRTFVSSCVEPATALGFRYLVILISEKVLGRLVWRYRRPA